MQRITVSHVCEAHSPTLPSLPNSLHSKSEANVITVLLLLLLLVLLFGGLGIFVARVFLIGLVLALIIGLVASYSGRARRGV